jgi:polyhydroxybutyrate depolymerase
MKFIAALCVLLALPASLFADVRHLPHQGSNRLFRVHNANISKPGPVVVVLHGYRNKRTAIADRDRLDETAWTKIEALSEKQGFVAVHPAAYAGQWNLVDGLKNTDLPDGQNIDDVGFIHNLVAHLIAEGIADKERVYLAGISDGAIFSYKLICQADTPFAAVVSMIGTMHENDKRDCANKNPPPTMVIAGTRDRILPYDGWIFKLGREISVPETMEHFRLLQGCQRQKGKRLADINKDDNSYVFRNTWTKCRRENSVVLLRVTGGGHTLPKYQPVSERWLKKAGGHNQDIEAAEVLWDFVRQFRKSDTDSQSD